MHNQKQVTNLLVSVNVGGLQRVAALYDVLDLALHLADVQARHRELLLELAHSVHIQLQVQLRPSHGRANLCQVAEKVREQFGDALALVRRHVAQLLKLSGSGGQGGLGIKGMSYLWQEMVYVNVNILIRYADGRT